MNKSLQGFVFLQWGHGEDPHQHLNVQNSIFEENINKIKIGERIPLLHLNVFGIVHGKTQSILRKVFIRQREECSVYGIEHKETHISAPYSLTMKIQSNLFVT